MTQAFIFPGQGSQVVGMGKDFYDTYPQAKETFERANDLLGASLTKVLFEGPEEELKKTQNSQLAIFVTSVAILNVVQSQFPNLTPTICSGHSLGEYSALVAAKKLSFESALNIVNQRGRYMDEACHQHEGMMAAVIGLSKEDVYQGIQEINLPKELWVANENCPGQIVISGTSHGIEKGMEHLKEKGAKRVLPLKVQGAFHSGLMKSAALHLKPILDSLEVKASSIDVVVNVTGNVASEKEIPRFLFEQVTGSVRWDTGVETMVSSGITTFIELGVGKVLAGLNKRICPDVKTLTVGTIQDLETL